MGIREEDAEKLSRDTARSLTVLRRRLSPISKQPEWAKPERAREILPVLLVGKWDENKQGDKEIISEIAEISYNELISTLKKWLYKPDPPILKIGEIWRLTSPFDAFFALSRFLTENNDFEKLKKVSLKVLREIDSSLDLEPEKRWMASAYGKEAKYSKTLREGIAQTLVLIAVFGDDKNIDLSYPPQNWVDSVIRELLNNADWKLWHSLSDVLPLIAEASPSSFLEAVEDSLSQKTPPIMGMFSETDDILTSHSAHPSLLWALEGLAWDPNLLGRVTLILGKLARLDPGGKLANRPINSLRDIFLLWLPHTYATLKQRLEAIDTLIRKEPEIGWKLLISLMPRGHDFCSPTYEPRWRQFSNKADNRATIKEHIESISAIVDKILKNVGKDGKKWAEVMEHYSDLPPQEREKILRELSSLVYLIDDSQLGLWNKLREILSDHRSFPNAEWSLPEKELREIEEIYDKLEPADAIQDNKSKLGTEGLIKLAEQSKNPYIVGTTTAELPLADDEEESLFSLLSAEDKKVAFIQGYIWRKAFKNGNSWIKKIVVKRKGKRARKLKAHPDKVLEQALAKLEKKVKQEKREDEESERVDKAISKIEEQVKKEEAPGARPGGGTGGPPSGLTIQIYKMEVESRIKSNWAYPVGIANENKRKGLEAIVILTVQRDGTISEYRFKKRSKDPFFDESVTKAIERSNPLPPFPEGFLKMTEEIEINFNLSEFQAA